MEILDNFGFDPVIMVAQIINFLIILFVLKKFLYKPILETLKKRESTISEGLKKAEEKQKLLDEASEKERRLLQKAQSQAKDMLEDAKKESEVVLAQALLKSKKETEKMIAEAKTQIQEESRETEKRLTSHIGKLAVELLEKSSEQLFTEKNQKDILSKALKEIKTS